MPQDALSMRVLRQHAWSGAWIKRSGHATITIYRLIQGFDHDKKAIKKPMKPIKPILHVDQWLFLLPPISITCDYGLVTLTGTAGAATGKLAGGIANL